MVKNIVLIYLIGACGFTVQAEIVINSKGESVKLNSDKTWSFIKEPSTKNIVDTNDFIIYNGRLIARPSPLIKKIKNGENIDTDVEIHLLISANQLESIGFDKINKIIENSLSQAKNEVEKPNVFIPRIIKIAYLESNQERGTILIEYSERDYSGSDIYKKIWLNFNDISGEVTKAF